MKTPSIPAAFAGELSDIYLAGYSRGYKSASWQDIPDIGSRLPKHIDFQDIGCIESEQDQADALQMLASEAESNSRQYSPFEFTAHELNEREDSEDAWAAFDEGISDGILANVAERIHSAPGAADDIPAGNLADDDSARHLGDEHEQANHS